MHIANGMYGLILVEPSGGMPKVDREYYVLQSEFYTRGKFGETGVQPFDMQKALDERPEYVVFNGSVGALAGEKAISAKVGETVRLFVGNGGPNLVSSFHVIGEIFDVVHRESGTKPNQENVQTTLIPAGGSALVEFKVDVPGTFLLVDHSIFRTFNKGALGMLKVEGPTDKKIYSGKQSDMVYLPEGGSVQKVPGTPTVGKTARTFKERMEAGAIVYARNCKACHSASGQGVAHAFPPLAKSDYLMKNKKRAIDVVVNGLQGEITVNNKKYNGVMPSLGLSDEQFANVLTYIRNSWGNKGSAVTPAEARRKSGGH